MLEHIRGLVTKVLIAPIARVLLRIGLTPDAITVIGTFFTCAAALWFAPRGELMTALVLVTVSRALARRFDRHRRIARITWPLWMYVSVTGVIVYLMLYRM